MAADGPYPRSIRIDGLRRSVSDLQRSIDFYCGAMGFERPRRGSPSIVRTVRLRLGEQHIDLVVHADAAPPPATANAPDPRFQHAAIVTGDMDAAWHRLGPYAAIPISRGGPQSLPSNTGGVTAFKFRDPDGHPLELIQFPAGVGDPHWQQVQRGSGPTLGIDHFALVVEDIDRSTAFFAAHLDLQVTGRDVNRGGAQDRLDGLEGVVVDVVSLRSRHGRQTPHLELLRYRQPAFAAPSDTPAAAVEGERRDEIVCLGGLFPEGAAAAPLPTIAAMDARLLCDPDGHRFRVAMHDPATDGAARRQ